MPELPEVETICNGIAPHITNQIIQRIIIRQRQLRWPISYNVDQLINQQILHIFRRAKYIVVHTTAGYALWHLGMSGSLRLTKPSTPLKKHDHIDWILSNEVCLRYNDPRRFGALLWTDQLNNCKALQNLGPEPLSIEFNSDYLFNKTYQRKTVIKSFMMDAKIVVGVGNIYANESLFLAGIHPETPTCKLSFHQCNKLVISIKKILSQAIQQGGTTLKDFVNSHGNPGYFKQKLKVYGRAKKPCTKCTMTLIEIRQAGRCTVYCPKCQRHI